MPAISASTPAPVIGRAEEDRMDERRPVCAASSAAAGRRDAAGRRRTRPAARRRDRRAGRRAGGEAGVAGDVRRAAGCRAPDRAHRHDRGRQPFGDARPARAPGRAPARSILLTKISVGMRSRCSVRIRTRVCACTPSTAETTRTAPSSTLEHPLDLGDEVRVAGGVDQVDRDAVDDERDDGGLDGDAALPFQRQGVGLGAAVVDAADRVDDPGGVEQPLGQAGLTGVDMRQDSQVQRVHKASCPRSG